MSDTNVQGTDTSFNIQIVSSSKSSEGSNVEATRSNIDTGAISYLEIEDNLIDPGIKGNIALRNTFGILDRTKLLRNSDKTFFLDINLEDLQVGLDQIIDKRISFLGLIEDNSSVSTSVVDDHIVMKFEEAQTALLKKTSLHEMVRETGIDCEGRFDLPILLKDLLEKWMEMVAGGNDQIISQDDFALTGNNVEVNIRAFWAEVEDSVYDVLSRIYRSCLLGEKSRIPLLKLVNVSESNDNVERKFILREIFTDRHREFITSFSKGGDFADVYTEEFVIIPETNANPQNASIYNEVEKYDMLRSDIKAARESYWANYVSSAHGDDTNPADLTIINSNIIKFATIVDEFEQNDLGAPNTVTSNNKAGVFSNIPVLTKSDLKLIKKEQSTDKQGKELTSNQVYNQVKTSLMFLNDTIVFTVKGQIYRKPGNFITINGGEVVSDKDNPMGNLWYVISVKHRFKEMLYENEIVAVRLFGNTDRYSALTGEQDLGQ